MRYFHNLAATRKLNIEFLKNAREFKINFLILNQCCNKQSRVTFCDASQNILSSCIPFGGTGSSPVAANNGCVAEWLTRCIQAPYFLDPHFPPPPPLLFPRPNCTMIIIHSLGECKNLTQMCFCRHRLFDSELILNPNRDMHEVQLRCYYYCTTCCRYHSVK